MATWEESRTAVETKLQNSLTSELEVDGHRVRERSVNELVALDDLSRGRTDEELNGPTNLRRANFRAQAFNKGEGLI
jgi:hypothetical protein